MKHFRDFKIRNKLFLVFGASILFIGSIIFVAISNMAGMKRASMAIFEETFHEAEMLLELDKDLEKTRRVLVSFLLKRDVEMLPLYFRTMEEAGKKIDSSLNYMLDGNSHFDPESRAYIHDLKSIWDAFKETRDKEVFPAIRDGRFDHASKLVTGIQDRRFNEFIGITDMLVEHERKEAIGAQELIDKQLFSSILLFALISTLGFFAGMAFLIYASRCLSKRIETLVDSLGRVEKGELDFKIEADGYDEIGDMARSFNRMTRQLYEDRVMQEQSIAVMNWYAEESAKKVEELERLNTVLARTQDELRLKNTNLEDSIKEIREVNQKLADTKAQMIQSAKMASIGQLSAGVAHEINNPIGFVSSNLNVMVNYIHNFIEVFRMDKVLYEAFKKGDMGQAVVVLAKIENYLKEVDIEFSIEDIGNLVEESKDGIERVVSIVKGLKTFSHAGDAEMTEYDINKCLEDTIRLCWHEIKYKAELEREFGQIPLVFCHPQKIGQVFMNIIVNAAHAIPEKGKITLKTYSLGQEVFIKISDNGAGMTEEVQHRIFEPFFTTKPVGKGTGLGLSIAYAIVKEHKGSIDVDSKPGQGTSFTIRLPLDVKLGASAAESAA